MMWTMDSSMESELDSSDLNVNRINPWCDDKRDMCLIIAEKYVKELKPLPTDMPGIFEHGRLELGGRIFAVIKDLSRCRYKLQGDNNKYYGLKVTTNTSRWEIYMCSILSQLLSREVLPTVTSLRYSYSFLDGSATIYDYYPRRTVNTVIRAFESHPRIDGILVAYIGMLMADILDNLHKSRIIHADLTPSNLIIVKEVPDSIQTSSFTKPFYLKLINWERSIDMSMHSDQSFQVTPGEEYLCCSEMKEDRPWTYQIDYYGFVGVIHWLLFGREMEVKRGNDQVRRIKETLEFTVLCDTWSEIFDSCLNIKSCEEMVSWQEISTKLSKHVENFSNRYGDSWTMIIETLFKLIKL